MTEFQKYAINNEIQLRGRVITASADLESLLMRIILYSVIVSPENILREYKKMTLEVKISMAKKDLLKYHPETYFQYQNVLKDLQKICKFRNRFAHCKMIWDHSEKDISYFNLITITEVKGKEHLQPMKFTIKDFNDKMTLMLKVILKLAKLCEEIEDKFNKKYPDYFKDLLSYKKFKN